MKKKKKKASLSFKEAWERKMRIKENIVMIMSVISVIVAIVVLVTKIIS